MFSPGNIFHYMVHIYKLHNLDLPTNIGFTHHNIGQVTTVHVAINIDFTSCNIGQSYHCASDGSVMSFDSYTAPNS